MERKRQTNRHPESEISGYFGSTRPTVPYKTPRTLFGGTGDLYFSLQLRPLSPVIPILRMPRNLSHPVSQAVNSCHSSQVTAVLPVFMKGSFETKE
ncbi:uncharacterized protein PADG_06085 [Paracoccidioides brasiliensis Pb18]|uniref:Uncharacterized protein n=2 Tax=Paracoccidioides brasiliensis TaxID=121759 RepID=C1GFP9_PARBD|nr:uncharacterized protein PADG_06085 [Paracoccidioides brasiliensis Pb18]EEH50006.2 hypothetical protein PADG_06085 [Paracoccidioides brasiliensis Pb18]ODH13761.1 hypothetical protein ACO22_06938 [Paracoccidioides brasiliensis]ODH46528.1 hypothetical protein GX48_07366 [Paracoccidioides brasiliensis]